MNMYSTEVDITKVTVYLKGISKTFGLNKALDNVDLAIKPGEIHGLLGQNGCGKSTLIKILAGFHEPDEGGNLYINAERVELPIPPGDFYKYGLSFVHQDLGLIPSLTVLENLRNKEILASGLHIDWKKERTEATRILAGYKINVSMDATIESLDQVEKAMISIVRAVESIKGNRDGKGLLILDEPTVFLPKTEVDTLFKLVREVASEGISVLFVSHDLDEVMELTDVITVLRDGKNCGEVATKEATKEQIIEMILGKKLSVFSKKAEQTYHEDAKNTIKFKNIRGEMLKGVDFEVTPGEIVGLTGLEGSGFGEVPYVLFGVNDIKIGTIEMANKTIHLESYTPVQAVHDKIALIPADRPNQGGIRDLFVEENMMMQVHRYYRPWLLESKKMFEKSKELSEQYRVYPNDTRLNFAQLSGGNQQKALLAKWLQEDPELLILHEPTQGVDVGARQHIFKHIDTAAKAGAAVLCASSDYEQLVQICDRVIIFVQGKIVQELVGSEITKDRITQLCYDNISYQHLEEGELNGSIREKKAI
jgi:ribose transport system ATP-binding protein